MTATATRRANTHRTPASPAWRAHPASAAQVARLATLYAQYNPLVADAVERRGPRPGTDPQEFAQMVQEIREPAAPSAFTGYTKGQASDLITNLIDSIRKLRQDAPAPTNTTPTPEPGLYFLPGDPITVIKVQRNQAGTRVYTKTLDVSDPENPTWTYTGTTHLTDPALSPLDLDTATAFGRRTGVCSDCGRLLTNTESIERGIGPICAGKR